MERYIMTSTVGVVEAAAGTQPAVSIGAAFGLVCSDFTYDKDAEAAYDHLLVLINTAMHSVNMTAEECVQFVRSNRLKAHAKHGANSIEAKLGSETLFWLSCLGEEYGEACEVVDDWQEYLAEVIDLITVAVAWASALARVD